MFAIATDARPKASLSAAHNAQMDKLHTRIAALTLALLCQGVGALDLQGHRGARSLAPENTLPGFALTLGIGVTTLELDIAITKDDVLVISHDPKLNPDITRGPDGRFLDGPGPVIRQLSFAELQRYDVGRLKPGTRYAGLYPQQQPIDGTRIPRLDELFALVRKSGNEQVRFAIETKVTPFNADETVAPEAFARAVIAAIRDAGVTRRSTVLSFDWRTLAVVQKEAPEIGTVYLTAQQQWLDNVGAARPEGSAWTAGVQFRDHGSVPKMIHVAGGRIWSSFFGDLDAAKVKEAQALGIQVLAWTVNQPRDIVRMLDLGVDGIVSDRPDLVREEMQRRGMALPKGTPVVP
jgi:glycerophosphoryl diester phosphodiesterase